MIKKNFKNIILLIPGSLSQIIRNLILIFMISKFLGIKYAGLWGQITAIQGFASIIINLNLSLSIARYFPSKKSDSVFISKNFYSLFIIQVIVMLIIITLIYFFEVNIQNFLLDGFIFKNFTFYMFLLILSDMLFNNIIGLYRALQHHLFQTYFLTLRMLMELFILGGGIIYYHNIENLSLEKVFYLYSLSVFFTVVVAFYIAYHKNLLVFTKPQFTNVKQYFKFGIQQLPLSLSQWSLNLGDRVIVGSILGMEALGVYFLTNRIANLVNFFWGPVSQVLLTEGSNLYDKNKNLNSIHKISKYYILLVSVISVSIYILFPYVSGFIINNSYQKLQIYKLLPFLLVSIFIYNFLSIKIIFLQIKENALYIGKIWIFIIGFYFSFLFTTLKILGIYSTAIGLTISYLIVLLWLYKKGNYNV